MRLRNWWDRLTEKGPHFGYYLNPAKSILVVKPEFLNDATRIFHSTGVIIQSDGSRYLGAAIGTPLFQEEFMQHKIQERVSQIQRLSDFASTEPQAAYSAYVSGLQSKWTFFCRTQPGLKPHLARLDDTITNVFVPALLGRAITAEECSIFTLPCRHGGLGMPHPSSRAAQDDSSRTITAPLTNRIAEQDLALGAAISDVRAAKLRTRISCNNAAVTPYVKQLYPSLPLQMVSSSAFWLGL